MKNLVFLNNYNEEIKLRDLLEKLAATPAIKLKSMIFKTYY